MDTSEIIDSKNKLIDYGLAHTDLTIRQDSKALKDKIVYELSNQKQNFTEKDILINNLQNELKLYKIDVPSMMAEIRILFPELKDISMGKHSMNSSADSTNTTTVVLYSTNNNSVVNSTKLESWLKLKLDTKDIILIPQN
jgi:hypothetical protein